MRQFLRTTTRGSHARLVDDTGRVVSACSFVPEPSGSLPKLITMLRRIHDIGDRAIQVEQVAFVKFVTYCNEKTSVLEALAALIAAQNKKSRPREMTLLHLIANPQWARRLSTMSEGSEPRSVLLLFQEGTGVFFSGPFGSSPTRVMTPLPQRELSFSFVRPAAAKSIRASFLARSFFEQDPSMNEAPDAKATR